MNQTIETTFYLNEYQKIIHYSLIFKNKANEQCWGKRNDVSGHDGLNIKKYTPKKITFKVLLHI